MASPSTRRNIVAAADTLFYQKGFEHTSFADIAEAVAISRGNFYYHFKTKDAILDAVIDLRLTNTQAMLDQWEKEGEEPKDRILCFINILIANQANILLYGCPVGSLTTELTKLNHHSKERANEVFTLFRSWLRKQFSLLGLHKKSDALAMHVLARSQGVATLASAFHDEKFIRQEVRLMRDWLSSYTEGSI